MSAAEDILRACANNYRVLYELGIDSDTDLTSMADAVADAYWDHLSPEERGEFQNGGSDIGD